MTIFNSWLRIVTDTWRLGSDSQVVVGLRLRKLVRADTAAAREARLMVAEKLLAAAEVQMMTASAVLSGRAHQAPANALAYYRKKVAANRHRLGRKVRRTKRK
jgi:hypothetical protein